MCFWRPVGVRAGEVEHRLSSPRVRAGRGKDAEGLPPGFSEDQQLEVADAPDLIVKGLRELMKARAGVRTHLPPSTLITSTEGVLDRRKTRVEIQGARHQTERTCSYSRIARSFVTRTAPLCRAVATIIWSAGSP
jgi:hypothetical protein